MLNGQVTRFVGNFYEKKGNQVTKYYYAGAQRIAVRRSGTLSYLFGDHLGSTSVVAAPNGARRARTLYKPFGEVRYQSGVLPTEYRAASPQRSEGDTFTGQYSHVDDFGLMYYVARWYDPALGRFTQPDTIVPVEVQGTQAYDRFAYVNNNPLKFTDPTGHFGDCPPFDVSCSIDFVYTSYVEPHKETLHSALSTTGTVLQDLTVIVDAVGAGLELGGLAVGGPQGAAAGNAAYILSLNNIESTLSWGSTFATIADDWVMDGRIDSEASALSFSGSLIGQVNPIATIDLLIDGYLSGYNHNVFPGIISSIWGDEGKYAYENYKLLPEPEPEPQKHYLPIIINNKDTEYR